MKDIVIAVILAVLIAITIMHDISIYRLGCKVEAMQTFFEKIEQRVEEYAIRHGYRKTKRSE